MKVFELTRIDSDSVRLEFALWNAYCTLQEAPACPTIWADIIWVRDAGGQWRPGTVEKTNYPTFEILRQNASGSFSSIWQSPEGHWSDLKWMRDTRDKWWEEMELPTGCNLE